jgi:hypothetical protein
MVTDMGMVTGRVTGMAITGTVMDVLTGIRMVIEVGMGMDTGMVIAGIGGMVAIGDMA